MKPNKQLEHRFATHTVVASSPPYLSQVGGKCCVRQKPCLLKRGIVAGVMLNCNQQPLATSGETTCHCTDECGTFASTVDLSKDDIASSAC